MFLLSYIVEVTANLDYKIDTINEFTINEILNQDQEENQNIYEIMQWIGKKRGAIMSGGNIDDEKTVEREYRPFYEIKDMYPRYLFLLDLIFKDNVDGIKNVNIVKFIAENKDL